MSENLMLRYIETWTLGRPKICTLKRDRVSALGWTYERFDYLDLDKRVLSYGYAYTASEVFPVKSERDLVLLKSSEEITSGGEVHDLQGILTQGLTVYESQSIWIEESPKFPRHSEFLLSLRERILEVLSKVKVFSFGKFNVVNFQQHEGQVVIFFVKEQAMQLPLVLHLSRKSLVERRDYKEDTEVFELFVESIGDLLGGVVWNG